MILVGNVGNGLSGVTQGPSGVVEVGQGRRLVGGDADPPAFVEHQRRTQVAGVEDDRGKGHRTGPGWQGMAMGLQKILDGIRMGLLGNKLHCTAKRYDCHCQSCSAQEPSPLPCAFHFNSDGCKLQAERGRGRAEPDAAFLGLGRNSELGADIFLSGGCQTRVC